jgi:hypothetical protein
MRKKILHVIWRVLRQIVVGGDRGPIPGILCLLTIPGSLAIPATLCLLILLGRGYMKMKCIIVLQHRELSMIVTIQPQRNRSKVVKTILYMGTQAGEKQALHIGALLRHQIIYIVEFISTQMQIQLTLVLVRLVLVWQGYAILKVSRIGCPLLQDIAIDHCLNRSMSLNRRRITHRPTLIAGRS